MIIKNIVDDTFKVNLYSYNNQPILIESIGNNAIFDGEKGIFFVRKS